MLKGPADGVGNVVFGDRARALPAYSLADLDQVSRGFPPEDGQIANATHPTTSMGGAKPKLLVDDAGAFWIAKFPEKGDPVRFEAVGAAQDDLDKLDGAFQVARRVAQQDFAPILPPPRRGRYRPG